AHFLQESIRTVSGYSLPFNKKGYKTVDLVWAKADNMGNEAYVLQVTDAGIVIRANAKAGMIYGIQSLLQTLP
ncbi:glycoside hydrolase family 20 zincin-like fold domain-containing protein, partial [Stenotrophomonas maltophilia]|uniref:glycoside hydrolase family 20 zincin-like fold domain-containing protein n=1 Tax=Stenotrophomonas maltophilia TaxID=40324 RepID=UPI001953A153